MTEQTAAWPFTEWASDDPLPPRGQAWDLLVVGGGTAGLVAARSAASLGASVLLVERDRIGGDCLWTGCVPSKALLSAATAAADARDAGRFGVRTGPVTVDGPAVLAAVRRAIATIEPTDSPDAMRASGVRVVHASVRFLAPDRATLTGDDVDAVVRFRQALIATGSDPVVPPIDGLDEPLTNETVFDLPDLPARLLVVGGGSVGCESAQAFARLGTVVTLVESARRILPGEDADASRLVVDALRADGVDVRSATSLQRVSRTPAGRRVHLDDGGEFEVDAVLVATGRRSRTAGLGLDAAGVRVDDRGNVTTDDRLRTSNPRIWAAGDVTGGPRFTHTAGVAGTTVAGNAVLGLRRSLDVATNPRVTYTSPEVAAFGVGAAEAAEKGLTVRTSHHDEVDRALVDGRSAGFSRLVLDGRGRVVGATVVSPRAGESLAELVLAARHGLRARDLAATTHAYPTYGDGVWKAAIAEATAVLSGRSARRAIATAAGLRRRWVSRRTIRSKAQPMT